MKKLIYVIIALFLLSFVADIHAQTGAVDKADPKLWITGWDKIQKYIWWGEYDEYNKTLINPEFESDSLFQIVFTDSSVESIGQFILQNEYAPMEDDDVLMEILFQASDDDENNVTWAELEMVITDVTNNSKDSKLNFKLYDANSAVTPLYLEGNDAVFADDVEINGTITLENDETIDNATNGTINILSGVLKHGYDAAAYWTATQADGGVVTFAATSDGADAFLFSDSINVLTNTLIVADVDNFVSVLNDLFVGDSLNVNAGDLIVSDNDGFVSIADSFDVSSGKFRVAAVDGYVEINDSLYVASGNLIVAETDNYVSVARGLYVGDSLNVDTGQLIVAATDQYVEISDSLNVSAGELIVASTDANVQVGHDLFIGDSLNVNAGDLIVSDNDSYVSIADSLNVNAGELIVAATDNNVQVGHDLFVGDSLNVNAGDLIVSDNDNYVSIADTLKVDGTDGIQLGDGSLINSAAGSPTLASAAGLSVVNYAAYTVHKSVVTLASYSMTITDAAAAGAHGSVKLIDFPEGHIKLLGGHQNLTCTRVGVNIHADAVFDAGIGSAAVGVDNEVLAGTEQEITTKDDLALVAGTVTGDILNSTDQALDGSATASDAYLNVAIEAADCDGNDALTISGTVTLTWILLGDD